MLNPGIKGHQEITVEEKDLAIHVGSGTVHVLATPMMIANMEYTSAASVEELLGEGKTTVGVKVDVSHVAATPKGMKVTFDAELLEISANGKILTFHVEAHDECGLIGEGTHQRAVVDRVRFDEKTQAKLENK
ncbi:hypothetical protein HMPREF9623_00695 [Stomatobaculum longum]|jgi:hypothetical protein|uniref:Fluoroacetyl-CoA-specific thioesterase-like domain-containing protein n=1 Tax=Stomatobaculum longum TaxID=796942 RepID=A0A930GSP5_9FIRM|nr:thioesterase family protein [Stomatobaculum longum]EHO17096.1 hypothetical protein HMPREF9623_00695 [Stomatobaculum longum]MBF1256532.1 thioesterase family protein [Stomatobaculum longum]